MKMQEFLADSTVKAANDLKTALLALPEDNWNWTPQGRARTAVDMVVEVALNNEVTAQTLQNKAWPSDFDEAQYSRDQAALRADWAALEARLEDSTARVAESIRAVADTDRAVELELPWEKTPVAQMLAYPYWNAKYHEGQINYIAAQLGIESILCQAKIN